VGRFPEREIEEPVKLSGAEKKRSCGSRPAGLGRGLRQLIFVLRKASKGR
jgi:hypothetical protein